MLGPTLAAILVTGATPQLSTTIPLYWQGLLGLVFVAVVIFLPKGVLPAIWGGLRSVLAAVGIWNDSPAEGNMSLDGRFDIRHTTKRAKGDGTVLDVAQVSKNFGSFHALSDVSLTVKRGELLSIVGPNGAGKTSLVRCICDGDERMAGSILVDGNSIERSSPEEIAALGVARKFQSASVFEFLDSRRLHQNRNLERSYAVGMETRAKADPFARRGGSCDVIGSFFCLGCAGERYKPRPATGPGTGHGVGARTKRRHS